MRFSARTLTHIRAVREYRAALERLGSTASDSELRLLTRKYALSMEPLRVQRCTQCGSAGEAFAEIGSHLVIDTRARTQLAAEVVKFFDDKVFSRLPDVGR